MYIGVDLGGTNIAAGLVDEDGKLLYKESIPTRAERNAFDIIRDMAELALRTAEKGGSEKSEVRSIGIGSPGSIDRENGVLLYANNLPFNMTPMRAAFQNTWNIPVYIDNDANCAALGEASAGSAKGCRHAVMITLGTGVGGGVIIDRKIYSGFNGNGAELGHMAIALDGLPCTCGRHGCWESYASATALIEATKKAMLENETSLMWEMTNGSVDHVSGKTAFSASKKGDEAAQAVVQRYISYVAMGITNLVNIFQPEVLSIGGGISREGDYLLLPVQKLVERDRYTRNCIQTELKIATLGNDAGIIGAAMLGKEC